MKAVENILLFLFAGLCVLCGYFIGERVVQYSPPAGKVLVSEAFIDSLKSLKPDTVTIDSTKLLEPVIEYRDRPVPVPVKVEPDLLEYNDSIVNDSTWLVVRSLVKGELVSQSYEFRRSVVLRTVKEPYPVLVDRPVYSAEELRTKYYGQLLATGNENMFMPGLQLGVITKNNTVISGMLLTDFNVSVFGVGVGKSF